MTSLPRLVAGLAARASPSTASEIEVDDQRDQIKVDDKVDDKRDGDETAPKLVVEGGVCSPEAQQGLEAVVRDGGRAGFAVDEEAAAAKAGVSGQEREEEEGKEEREDGVGEGSGDGEAAEEVECVWEEGEEEEEEEEEEVRKGSEGKVGEGKSAAENQAASEKDYGFPSGEGGEESVHAGGGMNVQSIGGWKVVSAAEEEEGWRVARVDEDQTATGGVMEDDVMVATELLNVGGLGRHGS